PPDLYTPSLPDALPISVRIVGQSARLDPRPCLRGETTGLVAVGAEQQQAVSGHQVDQPAERGPQGFHIRIDIGMVVLEIADDGEDRKSTRLNSSHLGSS